MWGDRPLGLTDARYERVLVLRDLVVEADAQRLVRVDKASGKHDLLHARHADERRKPHEIRHREAVAERARDRNAETRRRRRDAGIAGGGDRAAAADDRTAQGSDGRYSRA